MVNYDGMKNPIQSAPHIEIQRIIYNFWQSGHHIPHIFVFAVDGTIPIWCSNLQAWEGVQRIWYQMNCWFSLLDTKNSVIFKINAKWVICKQVDLNEKRNPRLQESGMKQLPWVKLSVKSVCPRVKYITIYEEINKREIMLKAMALHYGAEIPSLWTLLVYCTKMTMDRILITLIKPIRIRFGNVVFHYNTAPIFISSPWLEVLLLLYEDYLNLCQSNTCFIALLFTLTLQLATLATAAPQHTAMLPLLQTSNSFTSLLFSLSIPSLHPYELYRSQSAQQLSHG